MRQPRISYEQHELRSQLTSAAASVATEAAWPGTAPSSAELQAVADAMDAAGVGVGRRKGTDAPGGLGHDRSIWREPRPQGRVRPSPNRPDPKPEAGAGGR
jgi:hypothetical protein